MWNFAQNGHWKSENSIIVISAFEFPMIGSLSADIFSSIIGWLEGNLFWRIFNSNFAIASFSSSCEIWFESKFDMCNPPRNAATPMAMIIIMINPLNVDFLLFFHFFLLYLQNFLKSNIVF